MKNGKQWFDYLTDTDCTNENHAQGKGRGPKKYCAQCVAEAFDQAILESSRSDDVFAFIKKAVEQAFSVIPRKDERFGLLKGDLLTRLERMHARR